MKGKKKIDAHEKAYVVTVDMGYGHQRAVHPLEAIAEGGILTANNYPGIPLKDREWWSGGRGLYETISRMNMWPVIGPWAFGILDRMQKIEPFYPRRDLSRATLQVKQMYWGIRRGWGSDLIARLNKRPLPLITSFFTIAFFAEAHGYKGAIYCICTDADVSRAWAAEAPQKSRIRYLVPNRRVKERLMLYGIREGLITVTGFPLPKENIGDDLTILKDHLGCRIGNLDPKGLYRKKYGHTMRHYIGAKYCRPCPTRPLTLTFAVGGAGAQRDIGVAILESLHDEIDRGTVFLNLVAGAREDVYRYYEDAVRELHLKQNHGGSVRIIYAEDKMRYFRLFNQSLLTTDILWTKPSELSFYAGLGLPIIMSPTIGSQEEFNKDWLLSIGAGFAQDDPRYAHEWLFDWLKSGWLAEAAMNGFLNAPRNGAYHVEDVVLRGEKSEIEDVHLL